MTTTTALDLLSCPPSIFASWLLENRFQNDQTATTTFLLESIANLPDVDRISEELVAEAEAGDCETEAPLDRGGNAILEEPVVISSCAPRAKFQAQFLSNHQGIMLEDANASKKSSKPSRVLIRSVDQLIVFPKPRDCQPQKILPPDMVLLVLAPGSVTYNSKPLKQICLQLPKELPTMKTKEIKRSLMNDDDESGDDSDDDSLSLDGLDHTDQWVRVFSQALRGLEPRSIIRVVNPQATTNHHVWRFQFRSHQDETVSTTTGDMPFVACYKGVHDGTLYPVEEGLLFFQPPLFIPRTMLKSIECGGRAGNSRYVDLKVVTDDDETIEFSNIHRNEINVINSYIHKTLIPAMRKDAGQNATEETAAGEAEVAIIAEEIENQHNRNGRAKRKAGLEAMRINKSVVNRADEVGDSDDESNDGDFEGHEQTDDDEGSTDGEDSDDGDDQSAQESDGDDDDSNDDNDDEETESETEKNDNGTPPTKKIRIDCDRAGQL
jgi:hypothetical protein